MTGIKRWQILWAVGILALDFLCELFITTQYVRHNFLTERHWAHFSFWETMTLDGRFFMAATLGAALPAMIIVVVAGLAYLKMRNWYPATTLGLAAATLFVLPYIAWMATFYLY